MNIKEKFGRRVRVLRTIKGWSQMELGFRADVNRNYISDLERGQRNVSLMIIERIAISLEVEVKDLFKF
jgi:Predicted transcriptional regulators